MSTSKNWPKANFFARLFTLIGALLGVVVIPALFGGWTMDDGTVDHDGVLISVTLFLGLNAGMLIEQFYIPWAAKDFLKKLDENDG